MKLIKIILSVWLLSLPIYAEVGANTELVDVNFRDLKIRDFIEMVSKITKRNILIEIIIKLSKVMMPQEKGLM